MNHLRRLATAITMLTVACAAHADLIVDNDDGLIAGTDALEVSFTIGAEFSILSILFNGDVDLWTSSPDTGLMQVFFSVDRLSVANNMSGGGGGSDIQFVHDVPNNQFIAHSIFGGVTESSDSHANITGAFYELAFSTSLFQFGGLLSGEMVEWGLVLTSAQSPATLEQVAQTGDFDRGREIFRSNGFTYQGDSILAGEPSQPTPVPEPGTLFLFCLGFAVMAWNKIGCRTRYFVTQI